MNMVDQIYRRLVAAPCGLNCHTTEVLSALGMFVSALLVEGWRNQTDRQNVANRFCEILRAYASKPPRHSLH